MAGDRISRRRFITKAGMAGAGLVALSCAPASTGGAAPSAAASSVGPSAIDLRGSGAVVVQDQGGQFLAAQRGAHFEAFERATGIKVISNPSVGTAKVRASIEAGAPAYDVVDLSGGRIDGWAKDGLLLSVDYKYFDPALKAAFSPIPAHQYGVPNYYYATQLAWDPRKTGATVPKSWADLWDTKAFPGPRTLGSGAFGPALATFEIALMADGVDRTKLYPLDLDRALKSLERIKKDVIQWWTGGAQPVQLIADGRVALASAFNGRVDGIRTQGVAVGDSWEQAVLSYDYWIVPKGAKNAENAMKYLAFVSQERQQARFAELITYSPTIPKAFELIGSERAKLLPTSPDNAQRSVVQDFGFWNKDAGGGKTSEQLSIELWEKWIAR